MMRQKNFISILFLVVAGLFVTVSSIQAAEVSPLVSTEWVAKNLNSITVIDVSKKGYSKGHIPGAVQIKWVNRFRAAYWFIVNSGSCLRLASINEFIRDLASSRTLFSFARSFGLLGEARGLRQP